MTIPHRKTFGVETPPLDVARTFEDWWSDDDNGEVRAVLVDLGSRLLRAITSPLVVSIYRAASDPAASPGFARQFYESGPRSVVAGLAEILGEAAARGEIDVEDCEVASVQFIGMVRGNLQLEVMLGLRPAPPPAEIDNIVRIAVDAFLAA